MECKNVKKYSGCGQKGVVPRYVTGFNYKWNKVKVSSSVLFSPFEQCKCVVAIACYAFVYFWWVFSISLPIVPAKMICHSDLQLNPDSIICSRGMMIKQTADCEKLFLYAVILSIWSIRDVSWNLSPPQTEGGCRLSYGTHVWYLSAQSGNLTPRKRIKIFCWWSASVVCRI